MTEKYTDETMKQIGRYTIIKKIGDGGMGSVFLAIDPKIHRKVAIKLFKLEKLQADKEALKRLYLEAEAIGKLSHPNIVTIYDIYDDMDAPYLVMEYLEGETLSGVINQKKALTVPMILDIAIQLCDALHYAHSTGIIHRDIKPANIILLPNKQVKLTDFGIAKFQSLTSSAQVTKTGIIVGTPSYMSPEQISGHQIDQKSDIFSVAVVIWELLVGRKAFDADSIATIAFKVVYEELPPPDKLNPRIPRELSKVILKALQKKPEKRYQAVKEFKEDLEAVKNTDFALQLESIEISARPWYGRPITIASFVFLIIILALSGYYFTRSKPVVNKPVVEKVQPTENQFITESTGLLNQNKTDEALAKVNEAVSIYPNSVKIRKTKAEVLEKKKDYNGSIVLYKEIVKMNPTEITNILTVANKWFTNGNKDQAIKLAQSLKETGPASAQIDEFLTRIIPKPENKKPVKKIKVAKLPDQTDDGNQDPIQPVQPPINHRAALYNSVNINSNPFAEVYVDNVKIGWTPISNYRLTVGAHTVKYVSKNKQIYEKNIFVFDGQQMPDVYHNFESYAKIFIQSNKQVKVYIDDKLVCPMTPCFVKDVIPGGHRVTIESESGYRESKPVYLKAGRQEDVQFNNVL